MNGITMKRTLIAALLLAPLSASAQGYLGPDGTAARPFNVTTAGGTGNTSPSAQAAFPAASIASANTYQQIAAAGSCPHGGLFVGTQTASTTAVEYVDLTSGVTAGGNTLSNGAVPVGGSQATNQPGQAFVIPPTNNAVFVYGPAGATFRGYCS